MASDGQILSQGPPSKATLAKGIDIASNNEQDEEEPLELKEADAVAKKSTNGKLIASEEISEGHVGWKASELWHYSTYDRLRLIVCSEAPFHEFEDSGRVHAVLGFVLGVHDFEPLSTCCPDMGFGTMDSTVRTQEPR